MIYKAESIYTLVCLSMFAGCHDKPEQATAKRSTVTESKAAPTIEPKPTQGHAAGIEWTVPKNFLPVEHAGRFRVGTYRLAATDNKNGKADANQVDLAIFFFGPGQGGSVEDNTKRWASQFKDGEGNTVEASASEIATRSTHGIQITTVKLQGSYEPGFPMPGSPMNRETAKALSNHTLKAAIAEAPQGLVFFKMTGPSPLMEQAEPGFEALINSITPQ